MADIKGYERIHLTINGVDRPVICDPDKDTLAVVLRRMGLTGTKIGCGIGVCGACSVVLNGELVRSCNKRMRNVEEYSEVLTIEGIGTPQHLHPIQQAWITYGGIGMGGFLCTLGMWDKADNALELLSDGNIAVYNTWEDMGQGGDIGTLTVTAKALEELAIRPESIRLVMNDSHRCPDSGVAAGSRSHIMNGRALKAAAELLINAMRKPDGSYRTYDEMIAFCAAKGGHSPAKPKRTEAAHATGASRFSPPTKNPQTVRVCGFFVFARNLLLTIFLAEGQQSHQR